MNANVKLYENLLDDDITKRLVVLCDIIEIYTELNDINKYMEIALTLLNNYSINMDSYYSNLIYYEIGVACIFVEKYDLAYNLLEETLEWSKENKAYRTMFNCIDNLFNKYNKLSMQEKLLKLKMSLLELLSNEDKKEYYKLVYKYIYIYIYFARMITKRS